MKLQKVLWQKVSSWYYYSVRWTYLCLLIESNSKVGTNHIHAYWHTHALVKNCMAPLETNSEMSVFSAELRWKNNLYYNYGLQKGPIYLNNALVSLALALLWKVTTCTSEWQCEIVCAKKKKRVTVKSLIFLRPTFFSHFLHAGYNKAK